MLWISKIYILISYQNIIVRCLIPTLTVQRIDRKLIAKKRQDTVDMCRMFNNENERFDLQKPGESVDNRRRIKRDIPSQATDVNPALNEEDAKRVEKIVEKLYDDMEAKGERVNYGQQEASAPTITLTKKKTVSARRFAFAPSELLGPTSSKPESYFLDGENITPSLARFKHGIVPYYIDSKTYDSQLANIIISAFDYFEKATCIRLQKLRQRPTDTASMKDINWIYITNPSGIRQCVHSNERRKTDGVQMIVFGYDCMSLGDIVHEVMHVLGFSHEHTRSDRDQHISILWDNIKPGYKKYFEIPKEGNVYNVESLPYDYASVLHYPARAFSKNGQVTILTEPSVKIGQREGLSEVDVEKVGLIYANECVKRNREYLLKTCPRVVKADKKPTVKPTQREIEEYFKDRLWPFGVINYKIRDKMEFSAEERENIQAVIRHIQSETCIKFREVTEASDTTENSEEDDRNIDTSASSKNGDKISLNETKEATNDKDITGVSNDERQSENEIGKSDDEIRFSGNDSVPDLRTSKPIHVDVTSLNNKDLLHKNNPSTKTAVKKLSEAFKLPSLTRRHASSILVFSRSAKEGCQCPTSGKPDGDKVLEISSDCFNSVNDLLHVFVHVMGLDHQHNMHDRDQFLHIVWNNLTPDIKQEMEKILPPAASVGFAYDYQSVMHYPWLQIKDGVSNMMYPVWNDGWAMGHWQGLSSTDVQKLNLLYFKECVERSKQTNN
ncbi:hypothetical protein K1T71_011370 [Dendrolimus kikuchii]|uniref:Uncharacterized protein n=1 Tax=Dendrolimus kikuchii TaxID=765133 RepID=A0ACC1CNJ8_9NEOP|nr:hypothetical protein K1T71_011370 [Dendrolimus kikuchii]